MATVSTSPVSESMLISSPVPMQKKILQDVLECIIQLKSDFFENHQPVTDDNVVLQRFCAKFEHLLQIGMKEKTTLLGRKKDYWDYFCECLASAKGSNDGFKYVKSLAENKTSVGRGRAFIRFCLVHQRLADTIQQCVAHNKTIDWFTPTSVLLDKKDCQSLINALYDLNSLHFDLSPRGYDLDMAWPSFSNRKPGPGGTWNIPISRRSSVTSMDTVSQISVSVDNAEVDRLARDLEQAQNAKSELIVRVEALQQEKEHVRQSAWATHGELQALQQQLLQLQSQHSSLQERYKELDINHMKLKLEKEHAEKYLRDEIKILNEKFKEEESKRVSQLKTEEEIWKQEVRDEGERKKREIDRLQKELDLAVEEVEKQKVKAAVQEEAVKSVIAEFGVKSDNEFKDCLITLTQHIRALQQELASVKVEKADIQNSLEKQLENNGKISILEGHIIELEQDLAESTQNQVSLQSKISSHEQELKTQKESHDFMEEQNNQLMKEKDELQRKLEEMHTQNIVLKNDLEKKDVDLVLSRSDAEGKQGKLNELSEIIESRLSQLKGQEQEIQSLKEELEKKTDEVLHLKQSSEGQATDLEKLLQKKDNDLTRLHLELDEQEKQREHIRKEAEESENRNTVLSKSLEATEMLVANLKSQHCKLEEKVTSLEASQEGRIQEVEVKDAIIKEADAEIKKLKNELASVNEKLVCVMSEIDKLHADQRTADFEKESLRVELKQMQAENENLRSEMNMEKNRIMGLLQESEGVKRSEGEKEEKIASLLVEIEQVRNEKGETINSLEQKIKSLNDDIRQKNNDISALKTEIENVKMLLDNETSSKSEIVNTLESDFQKLNTEKNDLEVKLKNIIAILESELKEMKEIHENETVSYSERIKNLESQLAEKMKMVETKCLDYEGTVEELNKELVNVSSEKVAIITKMESEVAALATERDRLLTDLNSALEDNEQNKSQLIVMQEQLTLTCRQLETISAEKISLSSELAAMSEELTRVMNENDASQRLISELKSSLKHAEDEAQEKLTQKRHIEHELEDLKSQLDKAQAENVELGIQLDGYQSQTQFSTKVLEENLVEAKDALELLKMELMQLQEKYDMAEKERENLKEKLKKMEKEKQEQIIHLDSPKDDSDDIDGSDVSKLRKELQEERLKYLSTIENLNEEISSLQFQLSAEQMVQSDAFQNRESGKESNQELKARVSDMEIIIEQLERELETLHKTKDIDSVQVQEMKKQLSMKHEECGRLEKDLQQVTARLVEETSRRERLESDHTHLRRSYDRDVGERDSEIKSLQSDNEQIKKKLVKLVKDKDTLWHKTDELVTEQKRILGDRWQENARVTHCPQCRMEFSLFVRKHHCRVCGRIFCWSCSDFWIDSPNDDRKIRACKPCYNHGNSLGTALISTSMVDAESDDEDDENVEDSIPGDKVAITNSTPKKTDVVSSPQGQASERRTPWREDAEIISESSAVYDDLEADRTDGRTVAEATRSNSDPEEDDISDDSLFQILDPDAVMKSINSYKHSSPASDMPPNMTSSMILSADDLKSGEVNRQNEVWIKPGKTFVVPVDIEQKNAVLLWEFTSHPKDIVFSVTYRTNELISVTEAEVIVAPCKCDSHRQTVCGELMAKQAGIYTLVFDNTYSKMISKKVHYSLEYKQP
ncbi:hypothetical protein BsWGS_09401 [Bradybaena similaris]